MPIRLIRPVSACRMPSTPARLGIRAALTVGGDRAVDEARMVGASCVVAEARAAPSRRAACFRSATSACAISARATARPSAVFRSRHRPSLLRLKAWNSALSSPIHAGPEAAAELALGRLDLDDARAHVGQQHRAGGAGADLGEVDDRQAVECGAQHGDVSLSASVRHWRLKAPWAVAMTVAVVGDELGAREVHAPAAAASRARWRLDLALARPARDS